MRALQLMVLWVGVLAAVYAEASPAPSEPTSKANARDNDSVIQKVRGLRNTGMKLNDSRDFPRAIEALRNAISLLHNRVFGDARLAITDRAIISQDAALYAQLLNDYGTVLIRATHYDEAIDVLEDSVAMVQKIYGTSHPSLGLSLRSLADAYMAKKAYKLAIQRYKTLRKHVYRGLGATHEAYIEASLKIAHGYKQLGQVKQQLKVLHNAIKAQGEAINGLTMGIAELYLELSTAHVAVGEIPAALRAAETASAIFLQREGDAALSYAFSLNALAGVKMRQHQADEAIALLERAHGIALKLYGEKDPITQASATTLRDVRAHKQTLETRKNEL